MDNGVPLTEIVASVDFDEVEMKQVYDPNSSLKLSMGLPPMETGRGRIDLIMDVKTGKVAPTSQPAEEFFYKAYNISYWTMPEADAVTWLNTQFGTNSKFRRLQPPQRLPGRRSPSLCRTCRTCSTRGRPPRHRSTPRKSMAPRCSSSTASLIRRS